MKAAQCAVAFVAFGNEIFTARAPIGVPSEDRNFSAQIVRRMQSAFTKHMCRHCRCRRFAMHSGDHNAALGPHNGGDGLRAAQPRVSATARGYENWIAVLNRGGKNDKVRSVRMLREMLFMKAQADPLQSLGLCRCNLVRANHCVSHIDEKPCKTAHTASRNTDKVNPMLFGGQKSRQIWKCITTPKFLVRRIGARGSCFRREFHEWYIFPSCSPRDQLHRS